MKADNGIDFATIESPSTIEGAEAEYVKRGHQIIYPGFREVVCGMIDSNSSVSFENDSYLDALFLTDIMFSKTRKELRMLTGSMGDGFLTVLKKPFEDALRRISEVKGGFARFIFVNSEYPNEIAALKLKYPALDFRGASSGSEVSHLITCDSAMAREEQPHGPIKRNDPISSIKAKVYFNNAEKTKVMESFFDTVWAKLHA